MAIALMVELKILGVLYEVIFGLFRRTGIQQLIQYSELGALKILVFLLEIISLMSSFIFLNHFCLMHSRYPCHFTVLKLIIVMLRIGWFTEHIICLGS
jgi:hypothetical protein